MCNGVVTETTFTLKLYVVWLTVVDSVFAFSAKTHVFHRKNNYYYYYIVPFDIQHHIITLPSSLGSGRVEHSTVIVIKIYGTESLARRNYSTKLHKQRRGSGRVRRI